MNFMLSCNKTLHIQIFLRDRSRKIKMSHLPWDTHSRWFILVQTRILVAKQYLSRTSQVELRKNNMIIQIIEPRKVAQKHCQVATTSNWEVEWPQNKRNVWGYTTSIQKTQPGSSKPILCDINCQTLGFHPWYHYLLGEESQHSISLSNRWYWGYSQGSIWNGTVARTTD